MPNRRLSDSELERANDLLNEVRARLLALAADDPELLFAYRRKIYKELIYDERSKPMARRALKKRMRALQNDLCPLCENPLPETYCVLDRLVAADGYTENNVRLICEPCDRKVQKTRRYS